MKLGFNEANDRFCKDHTVMKDLEFCEKFGFDGIDIQSLCLNRDLGAGILTLEELGEWFRTHKVKMISYNALEHFNMKATQAEKDAVMDLFKEIVRRCNILGCKTIVIVPSENIETEATIEEIRDEAVEVIRQFLEICEPYGIRLSLEFCGAPGMSINRFEDAMAVVEAVNSPLVGVTLDEYHFHGMASSWEALEKADGKKIFIWHLNGTENVPCGAKYNTDEKRLWPDDPKDCLDHKRLADTLKKIGYEGDYCTIEIFRPEYYTLSQEENVKKSAEVTKAHVEKYWD